MAAGGTPADRPSDTYVLGTDPAERERLRLQHELWRPAAREAWGRAGLAPGQRVLDLGAGPGFCALELARAVGPTGQVLALELSSAYLLDGQRAAAAAGLNQLELRRHDLSSEILAESGFDLAWCRWVAMFLPAVKPLVETLAAALRPGGQVVLHEYIHWDSFGLHPHGPALGRFGAACQASFRASGADPDVNRRLPALLAARGFRIDELRPLLLLGQPGDPVAAWIERFVATYGPELVRQGHWSAAEAEAGAAEITAAHQTPGAFWVAPTVMELRATRLQP
ncbi:methyltransferase domain-containing protein [Cyanobium sp. Morenito 9A2]|uniref:methyltransferase domain-containing protein n=1 Tax=Cyanobium sp. Morenito 9A2 TaxID=2823718 RepID=UPI0020CCAE30|nr:methyltransferase domain-containing protein [Cyanobium sp. Morenito 9A2]MCP9850426.1 methyltransferase domain-containing protein [Cyanobium sp. Morenito 9A2]